MCDIIDQLRDGVHIKFALGNMSQYNIDRKALSTQSRLVMQDAINNCLDSDNLINLVLNVDNDININQSHRQCKTSKQSHQSCTMQREHKFNSIEKVVVTTPANDEKREKQNSAKKTSSPHLPMIDRVLTHHTEGKNEQIFFFNRIGHLDNIVFVCLNKFQKSMNKKDRRIINQYLATRQGNLLH